MGQYLGKLILHYNADFILGSHIARKLEEYGLEVDERPEKGEIIFSEADSDE